MGNNDIKFFINGDDRDVKLKKKDEKDRERK
jgi:hypothetical protein